MENILKEHINDPLLVEFLEAQLKYQSHLVMQLRKKGISEAKIQEFLWDDLKKNKEEYQLQMLNPIPGKGPCQLKKAEVEQFLKQNITSKDFEIRWTDEKKGFGVFARRQFQAGETIMKVDSLCTIAISPDTCHHCLARLGSKRVTCKECKMEYATYCSETCEKAAWEDNHRALCGMGLDEFVEWVRTGLSGSARTNLMILVLFGKAWSIGANSPFDLPWFNFLSGAKEMDPPVKDRYDMFCEVVAPTRPYEAKSVTLELYAQVASVVGINAFAESVEGDNLPSGSGSSLFGPASFFNHSCEPNASYSIPKGKGGKRQAKRRLFYASRRIKKGEEIFISYMNENANYRTRQMNLWLYGFECECKKCQREKKVFEKKEKSGEVRDPRPKEELDRLAGLIELVRAHHIRSGIISSTAGEKEDTEIDNQKTGATARDSKNKEEEQW